MKTIYKNILAMVFILTNATMLPARRKTTVVIANKSNSNITAHTTTSIPPQTKAEITTTFTNIDVPAVKNDPLLMAIVLKREDQIEALLKSGLIPDEKVIIFAMDNGLPAKTIELLSKKAGYSNSHVLSNKFSVNKYAFKLLKDADSFVRLIESGVDFHDKAEMLDTIQCYSCGQGQPNKDDANRDDGLKLVHAFLRMGYGPDFIIRQYWLRNNCLLSHHSESEALDLMFQFGITTKDASWLLFYYIGNRRIYAVERLISYGIDINQKGPSFNPDEEYNPSCYICHKASEGSACDQTTPLSLALRNRKNNIGWEFPDNDKIIEMLVSHGAIIEL